MEKEIKFLEKLGYTVEDVRYILYLDGGRYCEDEEVFKNNIIAYKKCSKEEDKVEEVKKYTIDNKSFCSNPIEEFDILKVYKKEFEIALYNLVYKSL